MKKLFCFQDAIERLNVSKAFNKKLKAFTLIELIVSLLISGIIVLAAFFVINSFTSITFRMGRDNESYSKLLQFHNAIRNDMQKALKIEHYDDETIFHLPGEIKVSYQWEYDCMVRTVDEVVDTFFVKVNDWHMIRDKTTDLPIILELEIDKGGDDPELHRLVKVYDNDILLNSSELKQYR